MANITMRNEEEIENELFGDTPSTPTARYETVSMPTRDWNFMKTQNERILRELAAVKKKNGTKHKRKSDTDKTATAQKANCSVSGNCKPAEKRKFESDSDNDSSEAGFTRTQKRQKSDSDKEPADTAHIHNTNQSEGLHQNTDNNEVWDCDPDDILDRIVEPKRSVSENQNKLLSVGWHWTRIWTGQWGGATY